MISRYNIRPLLDLFSSRSAAVALIIFPLPLFPVLHRPPVPTCCFDLVGFLVSYGFLFVFFSSSLLLLSSDDDDLNNTLGHLLFYEIPISLLFVMPFPRPSCVFVLRHHKTACAISNSIRNMPVYKMFLCYILGIPLIAVVESYHDNQNRLLLFPFRFLPFDPPRSLSYYSPFCYVPLLHHTKLYGANGDDSTQPRSILAYKMLRPRTVDIPSTVFLERPSYNHYTSLLFHSCLLPVSQSSCNHIEMHVLEH